MPQNLIKPWVVVSGTLFTLFMLNYFSMKVLGKPYVYCFGKWALVPLLAPLWTYVTPFLLLVFFYLALTNKGIWPPVSVLVLLFVVLGVPEFMKTIGELRDIGGTCG